MFTKCKFKSNSHIQLIQKILFVENWNMHYLIQFLLDSVICVIYVCAYMYFYTWLYMHTHRDGYISIYKWAPLTVKDNWLVLGAVMHKNIVYLHN